MAIRQYYAKLKLNKQIKFHIDNIEKKFELLHMFVKIELQKVVYIKQDIVCLRFKKVERKNAIQSL